MRRLPLILVAVAAGLALADASIVALALPALLDELHTTITGVAAVIGVYTAVLALGILPAAALARRFGPGHVGAIGLLLFAAASIGCALSDSLTALLVFRGLQAAGGAAGLLAAFDLMDAGGAEASLGRRLWIAAAVFGSAAGPAIGGALTEALDWRAIFVAQAPVAAAAAVSCWTLRVPAPTTGASGPIRWRPAIALGLVSAALTAVLFLLVLELVAGWSVSPLSAALAVTVLPVAALAASRIGGDVRVRAATGCLLVAGGAICLAELPDASLGWTVVPQLLAGAGMGLAFPALAGGMLPERTAADAARLLVARHVGIVAALLVLAPVVSSRLDSITDQAKLEGVSVVLDARLPPQDKIELAPALLAGVETQDPRGQLTEAIDARRPDFTGDDAAAYDEMAQRLDQVIVQAVADAFRPAYLITGAIALLGTIVLVIGAALPMRALAGAAVLALVAIAAGVAIDRSQRLDQVIVQAVADAFRPAYLITGAIALLGTIVLVIGAALPMRALAAAGLLALVAIAAGVAIDRSQRPEPVTLQSPCLDRKLPKTGGLTGFIQDSALILLDRAACGYGSSREELVLALADDAENQRFKAKYHEDPRSTGGILKGLFG